MGFKVAGKVGMAILIIINIIFVTLGITLLVLGIVPRTSSDVFFEDDVVDYLNEVILYSSVVLGDLITGLAVYVIILGIVILLFGLIGGIAACSKNKCLLITIEEKNIRADLYDSQVNYDGVDAEDSKSQGLNKIQIRIECCGSKKVDNSNQDEFKNSNWYKNKRNSGNEKVLASCCKDATEDNYKTLNNPNCQENLQGSNEKEAIEEEAETCEVFIFITLASALAIKIIAFILTVVLLIAVKKRVGHDGLKKITKKGQTEESCIFSVPNFIRK